MMQVSHEPGHYRLYGVTIRSAIPLPGVPTASGEPAITLALCDRMSIAELETSSDAGWYRHGRLRDGSDHLLWPDQFEFLVSPDGRRVECRVIEPRSIESFQTYLLGHVLSFALIKQGREPLHATAVVVDGTALALLGPSGQGKTTIAAALLADGHALLTDDLLLTDVSGGQLVGSPGPMRLKLFPEGLSRLLPSLTSESRMNAMTSKLIVPLDAVHACQQPVPIGAFVVLDGTEGAVPSIERIGGTRAWTTLLGATFNSRLVDKPRLARQFHAAREWAARVPVLHVTYPWGFERLREVRDMVAAIAAKPLATASGS